MRKFLALLLAVMMTASLSVTAFAAEDDGPRYNVHDLQLVNKIITENWADDSYRPLTVTAHPDVLTTRKFIPRDWDEFTGWSPVGSEMRLSYLGNYHSAHQEFLELKGSLEISDCPALTELFFENSQLTSLTVSNCPALEMLNCSKTGGEYKDQGPLESLNISDCPNLRSLGCSRNGLTKLDLTGCLKLEGVFCDENRNLSALILEGCTDLTHLNCAGTRIETLDLSKLPKLTDLTCGRNGYLTDIDLSGCAKLTHLAIYASNIDTLDLSDCRALQELIVDASKNLTSLDISRNPNLLKLDCSQNGLTALDISKNWNLWHLYCNGNKLTTLDVSGNPKLEVLNCSENSLTSLRLANPSSLHWLDCRFNDMADESAVTGFRRTWFSQERIEELDRSVGLWTVHDLFAFAPQGKPWKDPDAPEQPGKPSVPSDPFSTPRKESAPPAATENKANDTKTLDAVKAGETAEVKLMNGAAGISTGTMDTLGTSSGELTVTNNKMTVTIPGGFGKITEAGRIYYLFDCIDNLANAGDLAKPVKGDNAKTEVLKAGGNMQMPTTVTVTLKTKLTGKVNVYYYDDNTGKYTLLASPMAEDGKITFATKQLGHMILTTGTI